MEVKDPIQCKCGTRIEVWLEEASGVRHELTSAAAPQAPPKHFTDEELKQQYGIHLATRLQADADGKEAKWADIDDDEDDWAPDTIEWTDGTKITLSHNDPALALAEEQALAAAEKEREEEEKRAKMPPPKATTSVGPNAKVLKLGASIQPKQGGIALKSSNDKPTLVAKPTPPPPVRSPWASLPPVDKVPPTDINPPMQIQLSRSLQRDSFGAESNPPPAPSPAMEIAADSFTRTPRDTQGGSQGQLYNSQSGRYEPVTSGRRGSVRRDQNFRPPSLLQRPSPQDQQGPAEPSAAFQTQRSGSQQSGTRWDRRTSSTVSGGSGPQGRRMSLVKGAIDAQQQPIDAQPLQSPLTPVSSQAKVTPNGVLTSPSPAPASSQQADDPTVAAASSQMARSQLGDNVTKAQIPLDIDAQREAQKQLMKEKRELAIKRKKEEEQREEAAKRERIRIMMEAQGMAPLEKKGTEKEEAGKKQIEVKQVAKREVKHEASELPSPPPDSVASPAAAAPPASSVPPNPPVPDASGMPQQYGMMKIHGPSLANGLPSASERPVEGKSRAPAPEQHMPSPKTDPPSRLDERVPSPMVNGDIFSNHRGPSLPGSPETRNQSLYRPQRQQPWNNVSRDPDNLTSGWTAGGMATHSTPTGNLWGPPTNHRALGNGTFDRSVQRPSSRQAPYQEPHVQHTPQPIGPPKRSPDSGRTPFAGQLPAAEDFQTMPSYPSSETPVIAAKRGDNSIGPIGVEQPTTSSPPGPSAQPRPQISPERLPHGQDGKTASLSAWGNFQSTSAKEDHEKRQQALQQQAARLAEEERTGIRYEPQMPTLNETWRQVKIDEEAGQRRVIAVAKAPNQPESVPSHQMKGEIHSPPFSNQAHMGPFANSGRGSRFFPTAGQGFHNQQRAVSYTMSYNRSPSPPPPDGMQHPAYARSQQHPLVNLPIMKPKPTVKLPPAMVTAPPTPVMAEIHAAPLRAVSQPLVNSPLWVTRINGLFDRKPNKSPEKKPAEVVGFSETKVPLELPKVATSAAVSLPSIDEDRAIHDVVGSVVTKAVEDEEALFDEREFGSTPTVSLPTPDPNWQKPKQSKHNKTKRGPHKVLDPTNVDPWSREAFAFSPEDKDQVFINLPGMKIPKSKTMPVLSTPSTHHGCNRTHRNFSGPMRAGRGGRSRDLSASFDSQKPTSSGLPRGQPQRASKTQSRGHWAKGQNNWGNPRVSQVATAH